MPISKRLHDILNNPEVLQGTDAFTAWICAEVDASTPAEVCQRFGIKGPYLTALTRGRASVGPKAAKRFGWKHVSFAFYEPIPALAKKPAEAP